MVGLNLKEVVEETLEKEMAEVVRQVQKNWRRKRDGIMERY